MTMTRVVVLGLVALFAAPADASQEQSAKDVVARVQKFYKSTKQYKAKFKQTYTNSVANKQTPSSGWLRAKKPGKLRWDYSKNKKTRQNFVAVGKRLWSVDHDAKQVVIGKVSSSLDAVALSFLVGKGDLSKQFTAKISSKSGYGKKDDIVLELKPKKASARYTKLYLVVSPKDYRVKQSVVEEASGNTNSFEFFQPNTTSKIKSSIFKVPVKKLKRRKYKIIR